MHFFKDSKTKAEGWSSLKMTKGQGMVSSHSPIPMRRETIPKMDFAQYQKSIFVMLFDAELHGALILDVGGGT